MAPAPDSPKRSAPPSSAASPAALPAEPRRGDPPLAIRHLVSIDDLSVPQIEALFRLARGFSEDLRRHAHLCPGLISASLFYEPSTRTRLSFESAMLRLGGGVLTAADMQASSAKKGESLADTVRVVSGAYADLIVLRHPSEGAARLAARASSVPVINAGDGAHEHPTQTLCDLYTLWIEKGHLDGLDVVLAGDLRYSRTIHSFIFALARFRANVVCVPHQGLELPDYVVKRLREEYGMEPIRADASRLGELARESDAAYITPQKPHQLSLFTDASGLKVERVDAVYMTRPQTERFAKLEDTRRYVKLGKQQMAVDGLKEAVVMHPLPRRDELSEDLDSDPRSLYFKQAARGVPMRMAILAHLLGRVDLGAPGPAAEPGFYSLPEGPNLCGNPNCISRTEDRHVRPAFRLLARLPLRAACAFCEREFAPLWVGLRSERRCVAPEALRSRRWEPEDLIFFAQESEAHELGYLSS
jgi:aspartate carbamoyltransferase catalytic subunit